MEGSMCRQVQAPEVSSRGKRTERMFLCKRRALENMAHLSYADGGSDGSNQLQRVRLGETQKVRDL